MALAQAPRYGLTVRAEDAFHAPPVVWRLRPVTAAGANARGRFLYVGPQELHEASASKFLSFAQQPTFAGSLLVVDPGQEHHEPAQPTRSRVSYGAIVPNARGSFVRSFGQEQPENGRALFRLPFSVTPASVSTPTADFLRTAPSFEDDARASTWRARTYTLPNAPGSSIHGNLQEFEEGRAWLRRPFTVSAAIVNARGSFVRENLQEVEDGRASTWKAFSVFVAPINSRGSYVRGNLQEFEEGRASFRIPFAVVPAAIPVTISVVQPYITVYFFKRTA